MKKGRLRDPFTPICWKPLSDGLRGRRAVRRRDRLPDHLARRVPGDGDSGHLRVHREGRFRERPPDVGQLPAMAPNPRG